ncbi:GTP-binding protein [Streptomyces boninensis]|uniref:GTP-binding protein n=1 Tax=Streptomyces boninensis TaxID=2039455 RepID=UPI003B225171
MQSRHPFKGLNLGILAHVDAGKTTLTERLLHAAGVIDRPGSVDDGSTQTDSLALERARGITIKSAVVSFTLANELAAQPADDLTVNLIDTPGHPDFIAEVERVLSVLDGVVLVVSAVEGVQAQTRVLMRTLKRLRIPTLIFVNKIDRRGADYAATLRGITDRLSPAVVPMGTATALGTREAHFSAYGPGQAEFTDRLVEALADHDDALLASYVHNAEGVPYERLRAALAEQTGRALVHPVYYGSAATGAGLPELIGGIRELLPAAVSDAEGPPAGEVFKVERGPAGEKVAYVRMRAGTLRTREVVRFGTARVGHEAKVTAISVFDEGGTDPRRCVSAGRIAKLSGLPGIRIGDTIGDATGQPGAGGHFAPPTLETVVVPADPSDKVPLHTALTLLAEQDPLINLRQDDVRQELSLSLYGEVQKEVIQATLADELGLDVGFRETTTINIERPAGTGAAVEFKEDDDTSQFLATVGLRVEPAPPGSGVDFRLEVELGSMPYAFFRAVEDTVYATLRQGLYGWEVPDVIVTMTHSGYNPRQSHSHATFDKAMSSTGGDFRNQTPLVLMAALQRAGTVVHEPLHRFHLEIPADTLGAVLSALARHRAVPLTTTDRGGAYELEGDIPAAQVHALEQQLPGLTRGEGMLDAAFDHYAPVPGPPPTRQRTGLNPLDRKEYRLRVLRRGLSQV